MPTLNELKKSQQYLIFSNIIDFYDYIGKIYDMISNKLTTNSTNYNLVLHNSSTISPIRIRALAEILFFC